MNITHAISEEIHGDKLVAIFNRQKELMNKYHDIEKRSGLLQTEDCPVNLNDKRGQARLKDFAWRMTEEVGEALDAYSNDDRVHFQEELIDGLHFLTEFSILAGMTPEDLRVRYFLGEKEDDILEGMFALVNESEYSGLKLLPDRVTFFIEKLGMTCNCLKNKPWKQSNMVTDKKAFNENLLATWVAYILLLSFSMTANEVADIYLKKSQVNKFRQRSNY